MYNFQKIRGVKHTTFRNDIF
jgi:hypothetical protein